MFFPLNDRVLIFFCIRKREIEMFLGPSLKHVLFDILFIISALTWVFSKLHSYNLLNPSSDGNFSVAVISFVLLYPFWSEVASTWAWVCTKALHTALLFFFFHCINTFSHPVVLFLATSLSFCTEQVFSLNCLQQCLRIFQNRWS